MARELEKWKLDTYSRTHTDRAFRVLLILKKHTLPQIMAAHYRAWLDGWTTSARMHEKGGTKPCIWCGQREGDKLQHFCGCQQLQEWRTRRLALPRETGFGPRREQFLNLCNPGNSTPNSTVIRGLALAASYHAYNACKHHHSTLNEEDACNALDQSLKEMVRGKINLVKLVDTIWAHKKKGTVFRLKVSTPKLVKVPTARKGLSSLMSERLPPPCRKLRAKPRTPRPRSKKNALSTNQSGKRKRADSNSYDSGVNTQSNIRSRSDTRPIVASRAGYNARDPKHSKTTAMVSYASGWAHEAGSCSIPRVIPTGPTHSGRRARFRIPLSQ